METFSLKNLQHMRFGVIRHPLFQRVLLTTSIFKGLQLQ
jgi:hypothetical protein